MISAASTNVDREAWAFIDAINASPTDPTPQEMFADWLEEHGESYCDRRVKGRSTIYWTDGVYDSAKRLHVLSENSRTACDHLDRFGLFADDHGMFLSRCRYCGWTDDSTG